jgi:uncharacterized surface protein with fasciclin (FAS1) repeats
VKIRRTISLALAGAALTTAIAVPAASAATPVNGPAGSVLDVLEADGTAFDFDILEAAARIVVDNKPGTTVAALANPDAKLTVLAPNDRAFQVLAYNLTGKWYGTEEGVLNGIAGAIKDGLKADVVNTLEAVLLYHVIGGKATFADVKSLSGTSVPTVGGGSIGIKYYPWLNLVVLRDADTNDANPWVVNSKRNIETSNGKSIIHGISLVLRPIDLP